MNKEIILTDVEFIEDLLNNNDELGELFAEHPELYVKINRRLEDIKRHL